MAEKIQTYREYLKKLYEACQFFYPKYFFPDFDGTPPQGPFNYHGEIVTKDTFLNLLFKTTGVSDDLDLAIRRLVELNGLNDETLAQTIPPDLEKLISKAEERKTGQKETATETKKKVRNFITQNRQRIAQIKTIETDLKDKVIYARVEQPEAPILTEAEQEVPAVLHEAAKTNPQQLVQDLAGKIKTEIERTAPKEISPEEIDFLAKQTALTVVQKLVGPDPFNEAFILEQIAANRDPEIVPAPLREPVGEYAAAIAAPQIEVYQTAHKIISSIFGENLAFHLVGPKELSQIKVVVSNQPIEGGQAFNLAQIPQQYSQFLENQNTFVSSLKEFSQQEIKSRLLSVANSWLDNQISKLPVNSALTKLYNSPKIQATLSLIGIGRPIEWVGTNVFGKIAVGSGFGPVVGWLGKITGINFGVAEATAKIAPALAPAAAKAGAKAVTTAVARTGLKAIFSKATAALGATFGNLPGLIIGWLVGEVLVRLGEKILKWFREHKDTAIIIGLALLAPGFLLGSLPLILLSTPFLIVGFLGGTSLAAGVSNVSRGFITVLGGLGSAFVVSISTPVIITLITFPIAVALILFIINSGAYLVPPSLSGLNLGGFTSPYVDLKKMANPPGPFTNSNLPKEIIYTVSIKPKKGSLENVVLSYDCQVISRSNLTCPGIVIEDKYKDVFTKPLGIVSATGISFTYKTTYDSRFKDSAIIDSIKLTAVATDKNTVSTETSYSLTFGNPPISCPVPGAKPVSPLYNYSYDAVKDTGHGSTKYWKAMGQSYSYPLPQTTTCIHPSDCSYYGYAYDVFPTGTSEVFAPTVLGKDVVWNCSYGFSNGGGSVGHTYICIGNSGNYTLVLTHMAKGARTGTIKSGENIGKLYNQPGNTHLHMEFQVNGRWQKPENYFCK